MNEDDNFDEMDYDEDVDEELEELEEEEEEDNQEEEEEEENQEEEEEENAKAEDPDEEQQQQGQPTQQLKISLKLSSSMSLGSNKTEEMKEAAKEERGGGGGGEKKRPARVTKKRPAKKKSLSVVIEKLIQVLRGKDSYGFFLEPVDVSAVPDYLTVIKQPMDFSTMKKKLQKGQYKHLSEFQTDFELICNNAKTFNPPDSIYHKQASKLHSVGLRMIEREYPNVSEDPDDDGPVSKRHQKSNDVHIALNGHDVGVKESSKKYSIYRRAPDGGFLFSSLQKAPVMPDGSLDPNSDYRVMAVAPADFDELEVTTLGEAVLAREKELSLKSTLMPRILEYDPYMSFAPLMDSSKSTITYEDPSFLQLSFGDLRNKAYIDSLVRFTDGGGGEDPFLENYVKCLVSSLSHGCTSLVSAVDTVMKDPGSLFKHPHSLIEPSGIKNSLAAGTSLANVASTMKNVNRAMDYEGSKNIATQPQFLEDSVTDLEEFSVDSERIKVLEEQDKVQILRDNLKLLDLLQKHQEYRFLKSEKLPSAMEKRIAMKVKEQLSYLVGHVAPKDLLTPEAIASVKKLMSENFLPRDPNYTGTLPSSRPFAYSSNLANASSVPITATMVPTTLSKGDGSN